MSDSKYSWHNVAAVFAVIAIAGFLVLGPNLWLSSRRDGPSPINSIGNNLRIIEGAKEQWALENKKLPEDKVLLTDLTAYFKNNQVPQSIAGETYVVTTVGGVAQAVIKGKLNGKSGPFTITNF